MGTNELPLAQWRIGMMSDFHELSGPELELEIATPNTIHVVGLLAPRRAGVALFTVRLEHLHYPPRTDRNQSFGLFMVKWEGMLWTAVRIPKADINIARQVAEETGVRIVSGVPTLLRLEAGARIVATDRGRLKGVLGVTHMVPPESQNVFTLENTQGHPMYRGSRESILTAEDLEIERIIAGERGGHQ